MVEAEQQTEDIQGLSYRHANGEVFEADGLEEARGMCPVLGEMSVEEAGLLLELEAIGKEQMEDKTDLPQKISAETPPLEHIRVAEESKNEPAWPDGYSQIIAETPEPERQSVTAAELADYDPTEDGISHKAPAADLHGLLAAQEAEMSVDANAIEAEEIQPAETVKEAKAVRHLAQADVEEVFATAGKSEEATARHDEEPIAYESVLPETTNDTAQPIDPEPVLTVNETVLISVEEPVQEEYIKDAIPDTVPTGTHEPARVNIKEQPEPPELSPASLPETAEAISTEENFTSYDLLEEDDVIALMAELERNKTEAAISAPELPAPVEEIETAINELADVLVLAETEETQKVRQILKEIIVLPDSLEADADKPKADIGQKLEELFIELFEAANIEYTPQLVDSFIRLTQADYLEEMLPTVKEEKIQEQSKEIGTREFLQKLQSGLKAVRQAAVHVYEIGKSVMRLYGMDDAAYSSAF